MTKKRNDRLILLEALSVIASLSGGWWLVFGASWTDIQMELKADFDGNKFAMLTAVKSTYLTHLFIYVPAEGSTPVVIVIL